MINVRYNDEYDCIDIMYNYNTILAVCYAMNKYTILKMTDKEMCNEIHDGIEMVREFACYDSEPMYFYGAFFQVKKGVLLYETQPLYDFVSMNVFGSFEDSLFDVFTTEFRDGVCLGIPCIHEMM